MHVVNQDRFYISIYVIFKIHSERLQFTGIAILYVCLEQVYFKFSSWKMFYVGNFLNERSCVHAEKSICGSW